MHLQSRRESLIEPMSFGRIWKNNNDYNHDRYLEQPRISISEENIVQVGDSVSQREFIDSIHNYQPRHLNHRIPGQILHSVESNALQTNDVKDSLNISNNRSSNHLDESVRYDRAVDFKPRAVHVNGDTEVHHSKRRRIEDLAPLTSDQPNDRSYSNRTVLVSLDRDKSWADSHEQLGPIASSSTMKPIIRRNSDVYVRPVEAIRYVDPEMYPRAVPYEANSLSRRPVGTFESTEALPPSSHSLRNLPAGSRQPGNHSLFSTYEAPEEASLFTPFRDEHMGLQSPHVPVTLTNSPRDAYGHSPREFSNRKFNDLLEHRPAGRLQYERDLHSDFARLDTGSGYVSGNSKPSIDGLETRRDTLVPTNWDHSPSPLRREAPTCIFLRELPDGNFATPNKAKSSSSTTRLIYQGNSSPRGDSERYLPFGAGSRVSRTWTPDREKVRMGSCQPNSRLANHQRYVILCILSNSILIDCGLTSPIVHMTPGLNKYTMAT